MPLVGYDPSVIVDDRYRIVRTLGEGGAAVVFLAQDLRTQRVVALKVVREPEAMASDNLLREAAALGRVHHPRVVALLASGALPDGRRYLATTYIAGDPLRVLLHAGPLAPRNALRVCAAIADGVGALHEAGMLHRDLKPENIMIPMHHDRPDFVHATLIDVGVFGTLGQRTATGGMQTHWGRVSGTPWYMAPEQLAGRPQTSATDIYGLGVLLYELLFGHPPMSEARLAAVTHPVDGRVVAYIGPFVHRRLTETITLPEQPSVSAVIRDVVQRLLRTRPADRPARMMDVGVALRAIIASDSRG